MRLAGERLLADFSTFRGVAESAEATTLPDRERGFCHCRPSWALVRPPAGKAGIRTHTQAGGMAGVVVE